MDCCFWTAFVMVYVLSVLQFSKVLGCAILYRLAVAILACFVPTVASW